MVPRKTLIYGFGPYGDFKENITESIVRALKPDINLEREVFDTQFSESMFLLALKRHSPEIIIGLGQHPRARKLRLERKAVNLWGMQEKPLQPIYQPGPSSLFVNLRLPHTVMTTVTYNAGTYVCNYSMYISLNYCQKMKCRFAFIHVPMNFDVSTVVAYVMKSIKFSGVSG